MSIIEIVKNKWSDILIGVISASLFGILTWIFSTLPLTTNLCWLLVLYVVIPYSLAIIIVRIFLRSVLGITGWYRHRIKSSLFRNSLKLPSSRLDFLFSFGGSLNEIDKNSWIDKIEDLVLNGVRIRILLLNPNSRSAQNRIKQLKNSESASTQSIFIAIEKLLKINELLVKSNNVQSLIEIGVYDRPAVWSMVFIDNKKTSIGFYAGGERSITNPSINIRRSKKRTLFDAFYSEYEDIWVSSRKVYDTKGLVTLKNEIDNRKKRGLIIVLTGPSGSGKTTYCATLKEKCPDSFVNSITYTTRPNRSREKEGTQYHFVDPSVYNEMLEKDDFFCNTAFCGNVYGVRRLDINNSIIDGKDLLLDSIQQISDLRYLGSNLVIIYLTTKTNKEMFYRISRRAESGDTISPDELGLRARNNIIQRQNAYLCDYIIDTSDVRSINEVTDELYEAIIKIKKSYIECEDILPTTLSEHYANTFIRYKGLPEDDYDSNALKRIRTENNHRR